MLCNKEVLSLVLHWKELSSYISVIMLLVVLFTLLLTGEGLSQCYTGTDCTGSVVSASNQRDCCVGTNDGLSFSDGITCSICIGMQLAFQSEVILLYVMLSSSRVPSS